MNDARSARRGVLTALATSIGGMTAMSSWPVWADPGNPRLIAPGAKTLSSLSRMLAAAPRRRRFKSVPMILTRRDEWDYEALDAILAYAGGPKQAFDNTELDGPWLNLMRNSMNAQVWSWKHPDFLCVSATHGTAHLALYDDYIWTKYEFAKMTQGKFTSNTLASLPPAASSDPSDFQKADGVFSPDDNSIRALQQRGAVFIACHNEVWEVTAGRIKAGINPDSLSHEALAAEFTNHLLPDVVLSPGAIGTLPELQRAGFAYAK